MTAPAPRALDRSAWGWALFEWARNPYILCTIYILSPYVATQVIGDPVRGQEIISGWHKISGLMVALSAPFLGAAADRMGARKPLLLAIMAIFTPAVAVQFLALPDGAGLPLWALAAAIIIAGTAFAWSEALHNAMLTSAAPGPLLARASGLGLALGNGAAVLVLIVVLFAFALPGQVDWGFLPAAPLLGLSHAAHEPSRIAAPIAAAWAIVFSIPFFLYARDRNSTGARFLPALRHGLGAVLATLRKLDQHRNVATFLIARMLYVDGKIAILIVGGVYAAGVMGWGLIEMLAFGITLSTVAVFGGLLSGWLDDRLGPKRAVLIEIAVTLACLIAMVSMSRTAMFFVIPVDPGARVWDGPVFQTAPELAYLGASIVIAVSITAAYASSRTLMAQLSPPGMEGELFGLYALAGAATVWAGPTLVEIFTRAYASQQAGFASIGLLLVAGFVVLAFVKPPTHA